MTILTALKHLFIPHEHNDYKPHFFREISVAIILAISIFLLGASFGSSFLIHKTVLGASVTANVLVDLTNESRVAYSEAPLVRSPLLDQAATLKAEDMSSTGYFAHNSPTGVTPWYWFQKVGYTFLYAGENLAINFIDAAEVRDAWLASPTHRANLLDVKFKEIGMATVNGVYKNGPTIYVVQMFGTPAVAKQAPPLATSSVTLTSAATPRVVPTESVPSDKVIPSDNLAMNNPPEIKGEAIETQPAYVPVITTNDLAVVKNTEEVEEATTTPPSTAGDYSTWYERLVFGGTYYVGNILKALLALVVLALSIMVSVELRRQHWKHIAYGLALLLIIALSIIINQAFW